MNEPATPEGLRRSERIAWLGFMLFFVVVLAIYIARGIGLERDVTEANRELLETQIRLAQYTRDEVPRPVQIGLTNAEIVALQRRGVARPERQLAESLLRQPELIAHAPSSGGEMGFVAGDIHVLNDRWVLARFGDGRVSGRMLLEFEVVHGNVTWQVIDSYLD